MAAVCFEKSEIVHDEGNLDFNVGGVASEFIGLLRVSFQASKSLTCPRQVLDRSASCRAGYRYYQYRIVIDVVLEIVFSL